MVNKGVLFRAWIVISLCWLGYFGWFGVSKYRELREARAGYELWTGRVADMANKALVAPVRDPYGQDKEGYMEMLRMSSEIRGQSAGQVIKAEAGLRMSYTWGPLGPLVLIAVMFVVRFILQGWKPKTETER